VAAGFITGDDARQDEDGFFFLWIGRKTSFGAAGKILRPWRSNGCSTTIPPWLNSAVNPRCQPRSAKDEIHATSSYGLAPRLRQKALQAWCEARLARFKMPQNVCGFRDAPPPKPRPQLVEKYKLREEYARGV